MRGRKKKNGEKGERGEGEGGGKGRRGRGRRGEEGEERYTSLHPHHTHTAHAHARIPFFAISSNTRFASSAVRSMGITSRRLTRPNSSRARFIASHSSANSSR